MSHIIPIGNSHGIRIPKAIIQQAGLLNTELELRVVPEGLLITPLVQPRHGWSEAFKLAVKEDKQLLLGDNPNNFDNEEWEW